MPHSALSSAASARRSDHGTDTDDMRLEISPIGADTDLRDALQDLKMGRFSAARDLLARTGSHWALRTSRSQHLVNGAAEGSAFKAWRDEEPNNPDACMMWARVLTRKTVQAHRTGQPQDVVGQAAALAQQEWRRADTLSPQCPVPWIGRLQLTQLPYAAHYFDPYAHARRGPWDQLDDLAMHYRGPWPILEEVNRLHPGNREGHHRMREYFLHRYGATAAMQYSAWLVAGSTSNPELLMLPLYSLMDLYRERHGDGRGGALQFWQSAQVRHFACQAYDDWFVSIPPDQYPWLSILDLSHLAHALVACGENERAKWVFHAMGPYAMPQPWKDINASLGRSQNWEDGFLRTRASVLR
ncbi:hypothetical protein ABZ915_47725 [Streptomyces sp. NPDC046915]|uniref:hypothetical protein n=1 Tax=Streptomyces sp. NPDC046915 TaxID=3155257 RepID=UPI0033F8DFF0